MALDNHSIRVTRSQKTKNGTKFIWQEKTSKNLASIEKETNNLSNSYKTQNLYSSLDGAIGGLDISSDYISCSEIDGKNSKNSKQKRKNEKQVIKETRPKGRPPKTINNKKCFEHIPNYQPLNERAYDLEPNNITINNLWTNFKTLQNSVMFISQQYDELLIKNDVTFKENRLLKSNQNKILDDIVLLKKENERLSLLINNSEQEKLKNSVVLKSLPDLNITECKEVLVNVATKLNVGLLSQDVTKVQKLPLKVNHKFDYLYQLKNCDTKNTIMDRCKKVKMVLKDDLTVKSVNSFEETHEPRIFITNHMTAFNYLLFKKAKSLHLHGFRYVWYKFGNIFARENNTSRIIRILSMDLVDDLILQRSRITLNSNTNTSTQINSLHNTQTLHI